MSASAILISVGCAALSALVTGWFAGFWWGFAAYVLTGAVVLLALAMLYAMSPDHDERAAMPPEDRLDPQPGWSDASPLSYHGERPPERMQVGAKRKRGAVFGIVSRAGGEGRAVPLGHLPQPCQAGAHKEIVGSRIH